VSETIHNAEAIPIRSGRAESTALRERQRLLDFIRRRVETEEDAEDILQDVFLQLFSTPDATESIEHLTAWLFTVARNKVIDWYRKKRKVPQNGQDSSANGPLHLEEILFDPLQDPDRLFIRSLVWTELADALDELPYEQKLVFVLHELEGRSFRDIAVLTGEPLSTLLSRKRYAVLHLRERLRELYDEFES
jgi:RNA polymerase sigma factor (sigma-70 family)